MVPSQSTKVLPNVVIFVRLFDRGQLIFHQMLYRISYNKTK